MFLLPSSFATLICDPAAATQVQLDNILVDTHQHRVRHCGVEVPQEQRGEVHVVTDHLTQQRLLLISITIFIVTGDRVDVELAEMSAGIDGGKQLGGLLTIAQVQ